MLAVVQIEPVRIRWGLGDFAWAWPAAVLVGPGLVGSIVLVLRGNTSHHQADAIDIAASTFGALLVTLVALRMLARRRGRGSLAADFGLSLHGGDWPWLGAGVGIAVVANYSVVLINAVAGSKQQQDVARAIEHSATTGRVVGAIAVVTFAPLAEELLFRGLLLRGLLRRMGAVAAALWCGGAFAAAHLVDPNAAPFVAPLALLGVVSSIRAIRTGALSQSIFLHAGFNLLSAISLLTGFP